MPITRLGSAPDPLCPAQVPRFAFHRGEDVEGTNLEASIGKFSSGRPAVLRTEPYHGLNGFLDAGYAGDVLRYAVREDVSRFVRNEEAHYRLGSLSRSPPLRFREVRTQVASLHRVNSVDLRADRLKHVRLTAEP